MEETIQAAYFPGWDQRQGKCGEVEGGDLDPPDLAELAFRMAAQPPRRVFPCSSPVMALGPCSFQQPLRSPRASECLEQRSKVLEVAGGEARASGAGGEMTLHLEQPTSHPHDCTIFLSSQERDEALDDLAGPQPENQVCFIHIKTCR